MRTLTGFTSEQARQANIASGRITASQAATLPIETSAISSNIPNNSIAITPSSLQPITQLTVPTNQPILSDSAITGSMASNMTASTVADTLMQSQQKTADTSSTALTDLYSQLTGVNTSLGNVNSSVDRTAQNEARLQADNYTNMIESEQLSNRRQIEKLQNENPTGMLEGGLNAQINDINRKSLSKQADLALLQNAANRNYTSMAAVADEMVKNNLSALTAQSENLKMFMDQNQSNLTRAESNLFNLQYDKIKTEEKKQLEMETAIADMKKNVAMSDAPDKMGLLTKLGAAKTLDEALQIAGKYGGDYLKTELLKQQIETEKAQRANIYADTAKTKAETVPGGGKPPTASQSTAAGFASRVVQSKDLIDANTPELNKLGLAKFFTQKKLPNALQSPLVQKELQAERNFVNAVLRRESGAAISPSEFDSAAQQYFPQPGDSQAVLDQKKANRDLTSQNLINESGTAYTPNVTTNTSNPFSTALGQSNEIIPGTSIIDSMSNGIINFKIPTN